MTTTHRPRTILLTGATSDIGRATARRLAVRFFFEPADAEDAAQEAVHPQHVELPRFDGRSALRRRATAWR